MATIQNRSCLSDLSQEEIKAALNRTPIADEERDRRHPHLALMRIRAVEAVKRLQEQGILDERGKLVRPDYLPPDMQPDSKTEC